ncbi:MAG TPA: M23 family metallopeptidase [bacterium]|nr:M23 family metallopeptidase [bacterium]
MEGSNARGMCRDGEATTRCRQGRRRAAAPLVVAVAFLGGLGAGVLPVSSAPPAQPPGILQVAPASPVQGDTVTILVSAPAAAKVRVRWDGHAVSLFALPDGSRRALVGTDPDVAIGSHALSLTVADATGPPVRLSQVVRIRPGRFGIRNLTLPPHTFGLITAKNLATEQRALGPVLRLRTPVAFWSGAFQAPSSGAMDSPYGEQGVYNGHREWWHQGVDFSAAEGSPIVAANGGMVVLAEALPLGGNTVVIDHGQGVLTEYLHLSAFAVHKGSRVARGALIGRIGATGLVTGPSLHWGLYVNGIPVNPLFWMAPRPWLTS